MNAGNMSEGFSIHCPQCQSTKLKSIRFGDEVGTAAFCVLVIGFFLTLFGGSGLWAIFTYILGVAIVGLIVLVVGVMRFSARHPVTWVCKDCGTRWQKNDSL